MLNLTMNDILLGIQCSAKFLVLFRSYNISLVLVDFLKSILFKLLIAINKYNNIFHLFGRTDSAMLVIIASCGVKISPGIVQSKVASHCSDFAVFSNEAELIVSGEVSKKYLAH